MKIDLKARLRSKYFWVALTSTVVLLSQQLGINIFPDNIADIVNTMLTLAVILGVVVDTSTPSISDNK